jgi:DNA invertase Pin-like site-specific DNA recombinase
MGLNLPTNPDDLKNKIQHFLGDLARNPDEEVAAIYTRVSRIDPRHHGYSMEIQPDKAEDYTRSKGWRIYSIYEDPARTGRNSRRPSLQRMINDIKAGRVTVVVVHRLDRLYRNLESLLKFIRMIKTYKVRLVSVTEQIDTDNWWGRLVLYVLGALAEMYIWQSSARTREAKLERVMNGLSNASFRFGYCNGLCSSCKDPNGKNYCPLFGGVDRVESQRGRVPVPHPIEKHAVHLAAHLYSKGKSDLEIANDLNRHSFQLPDGSTIIFRTKGLPGQTQPGPFNRDNIRDIVRSPFYVGLVAHYPTRPLDMDDDVENPKRKASQLPLKNKRQPQILQQGQHQAIYGYELWEQNMQLRQSKGVAPATKNRPKREYLLTGVGRCWVCKDHIGKHVSLRGSTGNKGTQYYRCATIHDKVKKEAKSIILEKLTGGLKPKLEPTDTWEELIHNHSSTLRADQLEEQIHAILKNLIIPEEWYEMIMAYYLSDNGIADFERGSYNLRQELKRLQELYTDGFLTQAQFKNRALVITQDMDFLRPSAKPESREIVFLLHNFPQTWEKMNSREQRILLKVMFEAIYFDEKGNIRQTLANAPFDQLLGVGQ